MNSTYNKLFSLEQGRKLKKEFLLMCSVKLYMSFKDANQIENQACSFSLVWRCYGRALKLLPECAQLWHDLGFNLYQQSLHADDENALGVAEKSAEALKKGLSLDSANHQIWNTLGLVYCHSGEMFMSEGIDDFKENIPSLKGRIYIYTMHTCTCTCEWKTKPSI